MPDGSVVTSVCVPVVIRRVNMGLSSGSLKRSMHG